MVREERTHQDDRISTLFSAGTPVASSSALVEQWLKEIRRRIPAGTKLSATVQLKPRKGFFASFRLLREGEEISSEARADTADEAIVKAGHGICEHLPQDMDFSQAG